MKQLFSVAALALAAVGAQAHIETFVGTFGPEAVGATGNGTLSLEWDLDGHTLLIDATFAGLSGLTNNAHIHCCTAAPRAGTSGVALASVQPTPPSPMLTGFPLGVSSGHYVRLIDLASTSSYTNGFVVASGGTAALAETRLMNNLKSGNAYFNIHSSTFGGGEIRAFVTQVPEPGTWAMMALGVAAVGGLARRRAG